MKPPFDIAADLDTPVSAYLKLKPFRPRFLLESVEGGERLARYSFIGFGDCLEVRLDERGLTIDGKTSPAPENQRELLNALREALARAPQPSPHIPGVPLLGGLVGVAGYDLVRRFERLPASMKADMKTPRQLAFDREIASALDLMREGKLDEAFGFLERAHVLGQDEVRPPVLSHWLMLRIALQRRDASAVLGQALRILLGALGSTVGVVPRGNTGGTNVSMFRKMPIEPELARLMQAD